MNLVRFILENGYTDTYETLGEMLSESIERARVEIRKRVAAEDYGLYDDILRETVHKLFEAGRIRIIKARVRGGKVQRRKKVSNVKGYTIRKRGKGPAKLVRMSPTERRKRKQGAKRAKIKRRQKLSQMKRKRAVSMRKRVSIGISKRPAPKRRTTVKRKRR